VTDQGRNSGTADDDARWAEALSILGDGPSQAAEDRLRRVRRTRVLLVLVATLVVVALAVVVGLLFLDVADGDAARDDDTPAWAGAVGAVLSILGGVLMVVGGVLLIRSMRRTRSWRRSLDVLTLRQRRQLVRQVRGRDLLAAEHIPLARVQAEILADQRAPLVVLSAAALNFVGINVRDPEPWRLIAGVLAACLAIAALVFSRRDVGRARRFLQQHPPVEAAR
jgi:hypothetical protein